MHFGVCMIPGSNNEEAAWHKSSWPLEVGILAAPLTSCMTLGKRLNFSVLEFPHLSNEVSYSG